jgi:MFS superfamily sulfate permease-like transporter
LPQFVRIRFGFHAKVKRSDVCYLLLSICLKNFELPSPAQFPHTHTHHTHHLTFYSFVVQVFIMVLVVAITLILDLAIAVIAGCLCACLVFAWDAGTRLTVRRHVFGIGESVEYTVRGPLYFGSVKPLMEQFFPLDDDEAPNPKRATVDLRETEIYDVRELML